ncbi:MAG: hypothetical protein ABI720_10820, partial [Actinomycetes bacterium]
METRRLVGTLLFPLLVIGLANPGASLAAAESDPGPVDTLLLASTSDDPFFGGRVVAANLVGVYPPEDLDALSLTFQRFHPDGYRMFDDPAWGVRLNSPATLVAGESYPLDGSDADVMWLADDYQWQATVCPDLT